MKPIWKEFSLAVVMGFVVPGIMLGYSLDWQGMHSLPAETTVPPETEGTMATWTVDLLQSDGTVESMDLEAYLVGVVLAEMPDSFAQEARKAQAVAARTYARRAATTGGKHGDGSVCVNSGCCQAYLSPETYLERGGTREGLERARDAVQATAGYVLTYQGELIEATYFSCSGGSTEDAVAVWGTDVPYLRATDSPGEEDAAHFTDTVYFTPEEFAAALGLSLTGAPDSWLGTVTYTAGGGVNTMTIGGREMKGTHLRSRLGLRSTNFTIRIEDGQITITTRGFGHRVGLSQYGADAMAEGGSSWQEILAHYYRGTTLELTKPGE